MSRIVLFTLLVSALCTISCESRHATPGAAAQASTSVNARIDNAAEAEAKATVAPTPENKAEAKAADKTIDRQERAEEHARLVRDALWALGLAALAFAIALECPALGKPMTIISLAGVSFAVICITLRALIDVVPYVVGSGLVIAAAWRLVHARMKRTAPADTPLTPSPEKKV